MSMNIFSFTNWKLKLKNYISVTWWNIFIWKDNIPGSLTNLQPYVPMGEGLQVIYSSTKLKELITE